MTSINTCWVSGAVAAVCLIIFRFLIALSLISPSSKLQLSTLRQAVGNRHTCVGHQPDRRGMHTYGIREGNSYFSSCEVVLRSVFFFPLWYRCLLFSFAEACPCRVGAVQWPPGLAGNPTTTHTPPQYHQRFLVGRSSPFMRLAQHPSALRAWCKQCLSGRWNPGGVV